MSEIEQQVHEVDLSIDQAKKAIARKETLERLYNNKDFQAIVIEGYFKDEASRLVLLKGDLNISEEAEKHCDKMINGIGCLRAYFQTVNHFGTMAEKGLEDHYQARQELLQEQLEGGEA